MNQITLSDVHEESLHTVANRLDMYVEAVKPFDQRRIIRERSLVGEPAVLTKYSLVDLSKIQRRSVEQLLSDLRSGVIRRDSIERVKLALRHLSHRKTSRSSLLTRSLVVLSVLTGFISIIPRADQFAAAFYFLIIAIIVIVTLFCVSHSVSLSEEATHVESFLDLIDVAVLEYDESLKEKMAA